VTTQGAADRAVLPEGDLANRPTVGLLARLIMGVVVSLAVAFTVAFFVDRQLTRNALEEQGQRQLVTQLELVSRAVAQGSEAVQAELTAAKDLADVGLPEAADPQLLMRSLLNDIRIRRYDEISVRTAFAREGRHLISIDPRQPLPPPPSLFDDVSEQFVSRVVPTDDDGFAYVAGRRTGRAPSDYLVVLGQRFDSSYAHRLREGTGGIDVVLLVDGEVVGTSLATLEPEAFDDGWDGGEVQNERLERVIAGRRYWLAYRDLASPGPHWGQAAAIGVLVPEPLAALDDQLIRTRTITATLLMLLVTGIAWLVSQTLVRPLTGLTRTAARIAGGDLEARFEATRNDEVGLLSRTLEHMRQGLREQFDVIRSQAAALRNAARRIVGEQDEARRRLAGELHDGVQQQLVMLRMHLGAARNILHEDPERIDEVFASLGEEADRILGRLRETAQGIYPSILRDRGLQGALFSLAGRATTFVDVTTQPDPLPRLDQDIEANAYFLVAEAVSNALKHAEPSHVTIEVSCASDTLAIVVSDDGHGFDPSSIRSQGGLFNLYDRAAAIGGAVTVRSAPGVGTTVRVSVPLGSLGSLQEEEDSGDAPVDVGLVAETELPEDGIGMLLDGPLRDDEVARDGGISLPRRHQ
jgi:signal transduction histidine kinase